MRVLRMGLRLNVLDCIFAKVVQDYNENNPDRIVLVSEARYLRNEMFKKIGTNLRNNKATKIDRDFVVQNIDDALETRFGYRPFADNRITLSPEEYAKEIRANCKVTSIPGNEGYVSVSGYFPISPYNHRYMNRSVVMNAGSNLVYVDANDIDNFVDMHDAVKSSKMFVYQKTNDDNFTELGHFVTEDDLTGMSVLKKYMSDSDYKNLKSWYIEGQKFDGSHMSADEIESYMKDKQEDFAKATAILDYLSDNGYEYTIKKDEKLGQLMCSIAGTKINVRLTDTPKNRAYIGRVYDNGAHIYFSTTRRTKSSIMRYQNPSPEDCVNLLKYALNEPVKRLDSDKYVGENDTYEIDMTGTKSVRLHHKSPKQSHSAVKYFSATTTVVYKGFVPETDKRDYGHKVIILTNLSNRSQATTDFETKDDAIAFLKDSVESAREVYASSLDIDGLLDQYHKSMTDPGFEIVYSNNPDLQQLQKDYINLLTGESKFLLRPGVTPEDYDNFIEEFADAVDDPARKAVYNLEHAKLVYSFEDFNFDAEAMVRRHAQDLLDYEIGSYEQNDAGERFNPIGVCKYMSSAYGGSRKQDDMIAALRLADISPESLRGNDFENKSLKDSLIKFDKLSAVRMDSIDNPFVQTMFNEIKNSLVRNGVTINDEDILYDKNGIVHYSCELGTDVSVGHDGPRKIEGEIGQLFVPDEDGKFVTQFASSNNYTSIPGYEAYVVSQKPGEFKNTAERTRLRGYEQLMIKHIRYQIRDDLYTMKDSIGAPTSCNGVYRRLYDTRKPIDFEEQYREQGMPEQNVKAIIRTAASRYRFGNIYRDGSKLHAVIGANRSGADPANDNFGDIYNAAGRYNFAILDTEIFGGYADPTYTSTGTNQGVVRALPKGAKVDPVTGAITPADDKHARTYIEDFVGAETLSFDPADRQVMAVNNIMSGSSVIPGTRMAQVSLEGWTQDDGIVVSKKFAESHSIRTHNGTLRPLTIGDKADVHGNKGVIGNIIDPDMSDEEAAEKGLTNVVNFFRNNPDLDIVMAAHSGVSRFNAGMAREAMQHTSDLVKPDGTIVKNGLGTINLIITDKAADDKTRIYDGNDGRNVYHQILWSLDSKGADHLKHYYYKDNVTAFTDAREYLNLLGLDFDADGTMHYDYKPHPGETRNLLKVVDNIPYLESDPTKIDMSTARREFIDVLSSTGGFIELPFQLKFYDGRPITNGDIDVVFEKDSWMVKGYTRKDGTEVKPHMAHRHVDSTTRTNDSTYCLPVLSSYLRSGQEFSDGTISLHDYTNQYLNIHEQALRYADAQKKYNAKGASEHDKEIYKKTMDAAVKKAQIAYDDIVHDVIERKLEGKNNIWKTDFMNVKAPASATSIVSADPRLDLDTIAISPEIASRLGLKDGREALIWRDPVLNDSCLAMVKVKIDDTIDGTRINPSMFMKMEGDFDGDTISVTAVLDKMARKEAHVKYSLGADMLNTHVAPDENGNYPFNYNMGIDVAVGMYAKPELKDQIEDLNLRANANLKRFESKEITEAEFVELQNGLIPELSDWYRNVYEGTICEAYISYDGMENHINSLINANVRNGAKGSLGKVKDYMKYAGVEAELDEENLCIKPGTLVDHGKTLATDEDKEEVQYATSAKAEGTGVAGAYEMRAIAALRTDACTAAEELTKPTTQAMLQVKHDAAKGKVLVGMLSYSCKQLWEGYSMSYNPNVGDWTLNYNAQGKPYKAKKNEWKKLFLEMYTSEQGLDVSINPEYLDQVADLMTVEDGTICGITEYKKMHGTPLDRLAYGGTVKPKNPQKPVGDSLYEMAANNVNIYTGMQGITPTRLTVNQVALSLDKEVAPLMKSDVQRGQSRSVRSTASHVTVGRNKKRNTPNTDFPDDLSNGDKPFAD